MTRARRHEDDDNEREIGMIEVARRLYPSEPPPFIDHDLSSHVQPGAQREVINSTDSGHWPLPTGSKSKVVCRAWANTQHKFWTYDVRDFRYIVKGFPAVHDGKSWVVYRIWDGEDHDLEESKGFGSRRVAFEYRPDTNPEGIAPEAMFLDRSSRREAFGQRGPRKADGNRTFRQMAAMVKQAERGMGSGPKKNGNQVAKAASESPETPQANDTIPRVARTRDAARTEVITRAPVSVPSPVVNTLHRKRDSSGKFSPLTPPMGNRITRRSLKRHREINSGEELDTGLLAARRPSRKRRQPSHAPPRSDPGTDHDVIERLSLAESAPQPRIPPRLPTQRPTPVQHLTPAQTPIPAVVKQEEQGLDNENNPLLSTLPFRSVPRSALTSGYPLDDEEAVLERQTKRHRKELEILRKEREVEEAEERLAEVRAKKAAAAAASQAQSRDNTVFDLTDD